MANQETGISPDFERYKRTKNKFVVNPGTRTLSRFRTTAHLAVEVELLHVLVGVADTDEGAELRSLLGLPCPRHLLPLLPPSVAVEVDAGRRTEEALLVAVGLLRHLGVQHDDDHVAAVAEVLLHGLGAQTLVLGRAEEVGAVEE